MEQPLVTCIMPTANRQEFISNAIDNFLKQDYQNKELVIIDDGIEPSVYNIEGIDTIRYFYSEPLGTIGVKRNIACEKAKGEFIVHWDDDDLYAPDWISRQVEALSISGVELTGLGKVIFIAPNENFVYQDTSGEWICGATMAYKKSLWERYPFTNLQIGEDTDFIVNSGAKIYVLDYMAGFNARIHENNVSIRHLENMNTMKWTDLTKQEK